MCFLLVFSVSAYWENPKNRLFKKKKKSQIQDGVNLDNYPILYGVYLKAYCDMSTGHILDPYMKNNGT